MPNMPCNKCKDGEMCECLRYRFRPKFADVMAFIGTLVIVFIAYEITTNFFNSEYALPIFVSIIPLSISPALLLCRKAIPGWKCRKCGNFIEKTLNNK